MSRFVKSTNDYPSNKLRDATTESQGGEIQRLVDSTKLLKILECPICREVPLPPIYGCTQGHMVCKECLPKLQKCGLCRSEFTKARNFPMEEIVLNSTIVCKNKSKGCNVTVTGSVYADHLINCEFGFNFVICNETLTSTCKGRKVRSNSFIHHLKDTHGIPSGTDSYEIVNNLKIYNFYQNTDNIETGRGINTDYFEYDGKQFVMKWEKEKDLYFTWLCVLNAETEEEIDNYKATIWIHGRNRLNFPVIQWKMSVHKIYKTLQEIKDTGSFACIPQFQLKYLSSTTPLENGNYHWAARCSIEKKIVVNKLF